MSSLPIIPLLLALGLSGHGLRKRSLSPTGSATAFFVGALIMSAPLRVFGVAMVVFYLVGSRATKVGKDIKGKLEEGHQDSTGGGYRSGWQVLSNSFAALGAAIVWATIFTPSSIPFRFFWPYLVTYAPPQPVFAPTEWCALSNPLSRYLVFLSFGHFACCLGDTLASELGILSRSPPVLITTLRPVPPGTNGGLSTMGTLASLAGGGIIGVTYAAVLAVENSACTYGELALLIPWGVLAGGVGSMIDSLMGATLQQTIYNTSSKRILTDEAKRDTVTKRKVVSGINVLTNNQVNLISSALTGLFMAWITQR